MALPPEIVAQLNAILETEPWPYRSPDYPDLDLGLDVWAWRIMTAGWPRQPAAEAGAAISQAYALLESNKLPHYLGMSCLVVVNSQDIFDILRVEQTDGMNYDLDTDDIIRKLSAWHAQFGLRITQASSTNVTIQFDRLPEDSQALIADLLEFCPDLYELTPQELREPIDLWWD